MRKICKAIFPAACLLAASSPSVAQQTVNDYGVATAAQERHAEGERNDFPWGLFGLLGLAGLLGLRRRDDDEDCDEDGA